MLEAVDEVPAVGVQCLVKNGRVRECEIGWREGVGNLADIEAGALPRAVVNVFGLFNHVLGPSGRDQIGLLQEIEQLVVVPVLMPETAVAASGFRDGSDSLPQHPLPVVLPDSGMALPKIVLRLHCPFRLDGIVAGNLEERARDRCPAVAGVGNLPLFLLTTLHDPGEKLARFAGEFGHIFRECLRILDPEGLKRIVVGEGHRFPFSISGSTVKQRGPGRQIQTRYKRHAEHPRNRQGRSIIRAGETG